MALSWPPEPNLTVKNCVSAIIAANQPQNTAVVIDSRTALTGGLYQKKVLRVCSKTIKRERMGGDKGRIRLRRSQPRIDPVFHKTIRRHIRGPRDRGARTCYISNLDTANHGR